MLGDLPFLMPEEIALLSEKRHLTRFMKLYNQHWKEMGKIQKAVIKNS